MSGSAALAERPLEIINGTARMLGDRILIRPLPWDTATTVIAIRHGRDVRGEVLAVGPGRYPFKYLGKTDNGQHMRVGERKHFQRTEVRVGDVVELGGLGTFGGEGYKFDEILYNGERCLICTERDICLIRDDQAVKFAPGQTHEVVEIDTELKRLVANDIDAPWRYQIGMTVALTRSQLIEWRQRTKAAA